MIKSLITSVLLLLVLSSASLAQSKITLAPQCRTKNENGVKCLESVRTCTLNANVKNSDGSVAKNKPISFEISGLHPKDFGLSNRSLSKITNSSGRAQLIIRPGPSTKGKKTTVLVTSGASGSSAISNGQIKLQICN